MPARPIMRLVRRLTSVAGALAIAVSINAVQAEDAWNPFKEPRRGAEAQGRRAASPRSRRLAPFDGRMAMVEASGRVPPRGASRAPSHLARASRIPIPHPTGTGQFPKPWSASPFPRNGNARCSARIWRRFSPGTARVFPPSYGKASTPRACTGSSHGSKFRRARRRCTPSGGGCGSPVRRFHSRARTAAGSRRCAVEALHRSGLLRELIERLDKDKASAPQDPLYLVLAARARVGAGDLKGGCADARDLSRRADVPKAIRGEMLLIGGYCALAENDLGAAGLAADLVRAPRRHRCAAAAGRSRRRAAAGQPFKPQLPKRLSLIDYRFLAAAKSIVFADALERAEPALLVALATDPALEPDAVKRLKAAELAARINALGPDALADAYRSSIVSRAADVAEPLTAKVDPALRRALLFKAAEGERTPLKRTRLIRALIDDARRAGLYMPLAALVARATEELAPVPEIGWFAETAIEIGLAVEPLRHARGNGSTSRTGGDRGASLQHWMVLVDIADPKMPGQRGASLVHAEQIAVRGRLAPDLMHRLATVLDALDYQIPIPLWEAASRTPQPTTGHLPETGVLTELQDASKKKEFARTLLLVLHALGPDGADRAHIIALGDTVRALRRAGLDADARRLALEAVFAGWPRSASH